MTGQSERAPGLAFWLETDNQKACEIARIAGFDTVVFDMEHGVLDEVRLDRLIPFCSGLGLATYVRVSEATQARIQTALDIGAAGVILPQIRDLAHASSTALFAKYPPLGLRGMGYGRTMAYGSPGEDFIAAENRNRLCYVMIETPGSLAEAAEIAALPCVDGLFAGPGDLSLSRGRGPFRATEADMADLARIAGCARSAGKRFAVAAGNADYRKRALGLAPDFVTAADDLSALLIGFQTLHARAIQT